LLEQSSVPSRFASGLARTWIPHTTPIEGRTQDDQQRGA